MKNRGFTLIELMVSVAIFAVIMVISLGALLSISTADKKAENIASVMNNLNFAVESMTRNIRTGYNYYCQASGGADVDGDCTTSPGATYIKFTAANGDAVTYRYSNDATTCQQSGPVKGCIVRTINGAALTPITAPEVVVTSLDGSASGLNIYLRGSLPGSPRFIGGPTDSLQPNAVIIVTGYVVTGYVANQQQQANFNIQTSVTQRLYDR